MLAVRLILSTILILSAQAFLSLEATAQTAEPACPSITVQGTRVNASGVSEYSSFVCPGAEVTFKAVIAGIDPNEKPAFNWNLSAGTISSGQGTSTITVSTIDAIGKPVIATVEVENISKLKPECNRTASTTIEVAICCLAPSAMKFDEYDDLSWANEEERLANLVMQLRQDINAAGHVIIYGPRRVAQHLERVRKFFVEKNSIAPERIKVVNGGFNKKVRVALWVVPTGAEPPAPDPDF